MESIQFRRNFSRNILIRMILLAVISAGILVWKLDFINTVYFRDQLTATGLIINGGILVLFTLGLLRMIAILFHYNREEKALVEFVDNIESNINPLAEISENRIIVRRYRTMQHLFKANTPVSHNSLAATLVASESTRNSFPKFINNTLILTGVFGTIVSLSIALIGASDLLASAINVNGMGMVVHGMSTALSTTITAIVSYIYFGYFFMKLSDVQTNLISAIEQVTTSYLMPKFQMQTDSVLYEFTGLIRSLQGLVMQMEKSQGAFTDMETRITNSLELYMSRAEDMHSDMAEIKELLKLGFRLPEDL
ncbi:MAG: hypothetical protein C0631_16635 [Sedimenticola sp.]|nr:MAG: hypothetical protein C0631_16635 [Sedimenticola sp.]